MLHIAKDAENFGGLENCSAFMFENYLQTLKRMVRSGRNPLIQVARRLEEKIEQKKTTTVDKISTKTQDPSAYVLSGGQCCEVLQVADKEQRVLCRVYSKPEPLFDNPCMSFLIGAIFLLKMTMKEQKSGRKKQLCNLHLRAVMTPPKGKDDRCVSAALMKV